MDNIAAQEHALLADATEAVSAIPGIRLMREKRLAYSRSCWTASTRTILNHSTHEIRDGGGRRAIDPAIMAIAGHVSRKMLEHYSHIRVQAKRNAYCSLNRDRLNRQARPLPQSIRP